MIHLLADNQMCVRVHISKLGLRNGAAVTDAVKERKMSLSIEETKWLIDEGPKILAAAENQIKKFYSDSVGLSVSIDKDGNIVIRKYTYVDLAGHKNVSCSSFDYGIRACYIRSGTIKSGYHRKCSDES